MGNLSIFRLKTAQLNQRDSAARLFRPSWRPSVSMQTHGALAHRMIKQEVRQMRRRAGISSLALLAFGLSAYGQNQSASPENQAPNQPAATTQSAPQKQGRSAGGDIGSGSGDNGKGAGKGAGNLAKGTGKGAGDLVTLHPVDAAGAVGKGGASAGKNV